MRDFTSVFISIMLFVFGAISIPAASPYGLETRGAVGAFLNNTLPPAASAAAGGWATVDAFPNLTFDDPTFLLCAPGTNRLYVGGRQGMIWYFQNDPTVSNKSVFLNLTNRTQGYDDSGLLGMAFHPEFGQAGSTNRGYVYVYYQYNPTPAGNPSTKPPATTPSYNRLSRFTVPDGSLQADPNSEQLLINSFDRNLWHDGGAMFFGADGFLYLTIGDEGASDDSYGNSQKINKGLFSGVLRIDVNQNPSKSHPIRRQPQNGGSPPAGWAPTSTQNYFIPNDNPFVNPDGSVLEEFFAIGFRSPHRMTYDPPTGQIWLADVGDSFREEVDLVVKGGNYQWNYGEGSIKGPGGKPATIIGVEKPPVYDYPHTDGNSCIIGGYVYRGSQHAGDLAGKYVFGDNYSGRIWALTYNGTNAPVVTYLCNMPPGLSDRGLSSFGIDQNNELYMCQMGPTGKIWKLARTGGTVPQPPALLSQVGAFTNLSNLSAATGLIPYNVNSPLWSDAAVKSRWMSVPNNGAPYDTTEQISFFATAEWTFPVGTVFVKHFALGVDDTNPNIQKRLETRLLVRGTNGNYYGLTYKWRSDNSDADLLTNSLNENIVIATAAGFRTQTWYYPSRQDCLICHNANANYVLGVKTRQLNGDFNYSTTGITDNQLRTLNHLGLFNPALNETNIPTYASMVSITNSAASPEARVRSYLDANCSQCHRPNSGVPANFDARFDTPLSNQGITNGAVVADLGITGAKVIAPGDISKSIMHVRMNTTGPNKMPLLARNLIDTNAVTALASWINSLGAPPATNVAPAITTQPQSLTVNQGAGGTFSVAATGTAPLIYQWMHNTAAIAGATGSSCTLSNIQPADAGNYSVIVSNGVGSIVSSNAILTVNVPPAISTQPQNLTVNQGASGAFVVVATGTAPLKYQWRRNSAAIAGATNSSCVLSNIQSADAGAYSVIVSNMSGSTISSNASLNVNVPPSISTQPQNLTVNQGTGGSFTVIATGTTPLSYQWRRNASTITGATGSNFALSNIQVGDAGNYSVIVSNMVGSVTSSNAVLSVNTPPVITSQPQSKNVPSGTNVQFNVVATGTAPLSYQWHFYGTNIAGASSSILQLINVQNAQAGDYTVVLSNSAGSITSAVATLTITPAALPAPVGLIGWWPGDGNANDIQGTNHGTLKNGTTFTSGRVGQGFDFDGLTNSVSTSALIAAISNSFTIEFWARPSASRVATTEATSGVTGSTGQRYAIFPRHGALTYGAGHVGAGVSVGTNGISVFERTDGYFASPLVYGAAITSWTHVAVVYENKQPKLYLNGVLKRTGLAGGNIVHPSSDMGGPLGFYRGGLDEVRIFNRALTASEIVAIYNTGGTGLYKGLEFTSIEPMPNSKLKLTLMGKTGGKLRIDASTNLLNWSAMTILTNTNGTSVFVDSITNSSKRFYRSVVVP